MRVMTYNIWDGGAERASLIADVIAQANPDVVLLNEADDERVVQSLARQLAYQPLWARGSGDKHIALLTRLPIGEWRIYNRRPFTQALLVVTLTTDDGRRTTEAGSSAIVHRPPSTIQLFCVHLLPYFMLLHYEFARWRTVRAILQLAKREAKHPHLIMGDFNAAMRGERADTSLFSVKIKRQLTLQLNRQPRFALAPILRAGYEDCFRHVHPLDAGLTWMPWALSARLDYIFADAEMVRRLQTCDVFTSPPAERGSDHFPLVADFAA